MSAHERLVAALRGHALVIGEVTLTSGAKAQYLIDARRAILRPEGFTALSELVADRARALGATAVGGLTMGADPLVAGVMLHSLEVGKPIEGFLVRRTAKDHGTRGQVEGNLAGHKRIAILDDVITSGESAMIATEAAESYKAQVVRVLAVVDRGQGAVQVFQQRGLPFSTLFTIGELLPAEK